MTSTSESFDEKLKIFAIPGVVAVGIALFIMAEYLLQYQWLSPVIGLVTVLLGSLKLIRDTWNSIRKRDFALDYIAILAIVSASVAGELLVASVVVLMLSGGNSLEEYALQKAKSALTHLKNRIPDNVLLFIDKQTARKVSLATVAVGDKILVRKGEVIPLDGEILSKTAEVDESSLTGEALPINKFKGNLLRSGTVNMGDALVLKVTKDNKDSTYYKIIQMVEKAQKQKSPLIRIADKYSAIFTLLTLIIAGGTFLIARDFNNVLAVLVIATPCPLILATPIALIGGMNAAARDRIIVKNLASLEILDRATTLILDKTGTITFGTPKLTEIKLHNIKYSETGILAIAAALERTSLHPIAKSLWQSAQDARLNLPEVREVHEELGKGLSGIIGDKSFALYKNQESSAYSVSMYEDQEQIAELLFEDQAKSDSRLILQRLKQLGLKFVMFTGDKAEKAKKIIEQLGIKIKLEADLSPQQKQKGIAKFKQDKEVVVMVGDGINDAPALAFADAGIVFSNEEQTAASEAADIVLIGGDMRLLYQTFVISKHTLHIARQSIFVGMGLSLLGMTFAAFGLIVPIVGALLQEAIDVGVILNALRAGKNKM